MQWYVVSDVSTINQHSIVPTNTIPAKRIAPILHFIPCPDMTTVINNKSTLHQEDYRADEQ